MAWKLLVMTRCTSEKCSSGKPVSMGLSYSIVSYFLLIRRWGWLLLPFSGLIFFPYLTGMTRSIWVLSRLLVTQHCKLHRSISHSAKGGGRGKKREGGQGHKTNLFLQVSNVYFPGSSTEDFHRRFPAIAEFGDVGGDVCFSGPFSSRIWSGEYAMRFTSNMSLKACQGEAGASGHPWPSAFLKSSGNLARWQLCPHLDLVHVSPRESQRFISFGVRCPLRKSVASLERSGLTTDLASSGPPQLLMIWITQKYKRFCRKCSEYQTSTHTGTEIEEKNQWLWSFGVSMTAHSKGSQCTLHGEYL